MIWHESLNFARVRTNNARNIFPCPSLLYVPKSSYTSHIQYHAMSRYPTLQKSYFI